MKKDSQKRMRIAIITLLIIFAISVYPIHMISAEEVNPSENNTSEMAGSEEITEASSTEMKKEDSEAASTEAGNQEGAEEASIEQAKEPGAEEGSTEKVQDEGSDEPEQTYPLTGDCGEVEGTVTWSLDQEGKLTISGTGPMANYHSSKLPPWNEYLSEIQSVEITEGVTKVGYNAFKNCSSLMHVSIPASVKTIGEYAFYRDENLQEISWKEGLETIEKYAFEYCTSITSVSFPDTVVKVGNSAFASCNSIEEITFTHSPAEIGASAFSTCMALKKINLGDALKSIGDSAFSVCKNITEFVIPDSVETIGSNILLSDTKLETLVIGKNVKKISQNSFACLSMKTVTIRNSVLVENEFCESNKLETVIFENEEITEIPVEAFARCPALKTITIPDSVKTISNNAFAGCTGLTNITLNEGLESIGDSVFGGCYGLTEFIIPDSVQTLGNSVLGGCGNIENLTIGKNVTSLKNGSFSGVGMKTVTIKNPVIAKSEFAGCSRLERVIFENEEIPEIPDSTFGGCVALKEIELPDSIQIIDNYAFSGCNALTKITLNEGLKTIGNYVFTSCSKLEELIIPDSVEVIGDTIIGGSDNLKNLTIGKNVRQIGSTQNSRFAGSNIQTVTIRNATLFAYEFVGCTKLENVIFESNGITSIPEYTFKYCQSLKNIRTPNSLKTIEAYGFSECTGLSEITLNPGLESIGDNAFDSCENLLSLVIPDQVRKVGKNIIKGCDSMINLTIGESVTDFGTGDGIGFYEAPMKSVTIRNAKMIEKEFYHCLRLEKVIIENSALQTIPSQAFAFCTALKNTGFTPYIKSIGDSAFSGCSSLLALNLPTGLETIGQSAFANCTSIDMIIIPRTVTSLGEGVFYKCSAAKSLTIHDNAIALPTSAFSECTSLESVDLGNAVISIGDHCFRECKSLTTISFPATVKATGSFAFAKCTGMEKVTIPSTIKTISNYSFYECTSLADVTLQEGIQEIQEAAFYGCNALKGLTIPDSVTTIGPRIIFECANIGNLTIGKGAVNFGKEPSDGFYRTSIRSVIIKNSQILPYEFFECPNLETVTIGNETKSIGELAFRGCRKLQNISFGSGLTTIGKYVFKDCDSLAIVRLSDSVTTLDDCAFQECTGLREFYAGNGLVSIGKQGLLGNKLLEKVSLGNNVKFIGETAFANCDKLDNVVIPDSVTSMGDRVFATCPGLTNLTIGRGLSTIPVGLCVSCPNLSSIIIPGNVDTIGTVAFASCSSLKSVTIENGVKTIGISAFAECSSLQNVSIPGSVTTIGASAFSSDTNISSINIPNGVRTIGNGAFSGASSLKIIQIPDSVNEIGEELFVGCTSLNSVTIGKGIHILPNNSFNGCQSLTSIEIPNTITSIGDSAFRNCSKLKEVVVPENVTSLGKGAFQNCSEITKFNLPKSLQSIGENCFSSCSSLTDIYYGGSKQLWKSLMPEENEDLKDVKIHYGDGEIEITINESASLANKNALMILGTLITDYLEATMDNVKGQLIKEDGTIVPSSLSSVYSSSKENQYQFGYTFYDIGPGKYTIRITAGQKVFDYSFVITDSYKLLFNGAEEEEEEGDSGLYFGTPVVTSFEFEKINYYDTTYAKYKDKLKLKAFVKFDESVIVTRKSINEILSYITWRSTNSEVVDIAYTTSKYDIFSDTLEITVTLENKKKGDSNIIGIFSNPNQGNKMITHKIKLYPNDMYVGELDGWCLSNYWYSFGDKNYKGEDDSVLDIFNINLDSKLFKDVQDAFTRVGGFNGYCFGFSMLSANVFNNTLDIKHLFTANGDYLSQYGYSTVYNKEDADRNVYSIRDNEAARKMIARAHFSQWSWEFADTEAKGNMMDLVNYLKAGNKRPLLVKMYVSKINMNFCHAVLIDPSYPIMAMADDPNWYRIGLYDPNAPAGMGIGLEKAKSDYRSSSYLLVNPKENKWQYEWRPEDPNDNRNIYSVGGDYETFTGKTLKFYDVSTLDSSYYSGNLSFKYDALGMIEFMAGSVININENNQNVLSYNPNIETCFSDDRHPIDFMAGDGMIEYNDNLLFTPIYEKEFRYSSPSTEVAYFSENNSFYLKNEGEMEAALKDNKLSVSAKENSHIVSIIQGDNNDDMTITATIPSGNTLEYGIENGKVILNSSDGNNVTVQLKYSDSASDYEIKDLVVSGKREIALSDIKSGNVSKDPATIQNNSQTAKKIKVTKINLSGISYKIAAGKKIKLTANVLPKNASLKTVIWQSSNNNVATVNKYGLVSINKKAKGKTVVITAKAMDGSKVVATYKIKVMKGVVKKVKISGKKTMKSGATQKLKVKVTASKGANKDILWTSSNSKIANVSGGKVKILPNTKGKKVTITAMAKDGSGKKSTFKITIK